MSRKLKRAKPLIYVFCEGQSEQAYTDFLKKKFNEVAVIKRPSATGLFEESRNRFRNDPKYRNSAEETDEIWFFFDVETKDIDLWNQRIKIIKALRKLRGRRKIKVRLLMTTGCIEYWLMLHFKMFAPSLQTVAEKENVMNELKTKIPTYTKGNYEATARIAENYSTAVINAKKTVNNLLHEGLPSIEDTDERNQWLCTKCKTFSTVYEAIEFLEDLRIQ